MAGGRLLLTLFPLSFCIDLSGSFRGVKARACQKIVSVEWPVPILANFSLVTALDIIVLKLVADLWPTKIFAGSSVPLISLAANKISLDLGKIAEARSR